MWKVCLCTRNKGQSVVHQWVDSASGSTDQALLTSAIVMYRGWCMEEQEIVIYNK